MRLKAKNKINDFLPTFTYFAFWLLFAAFAAGYSNAKVPEIVFFAIAAMAAFYYSKLEIKNNRLITPVKKSRLALSILLSAVFALFYVVGKHIHVTNTYSGTMLDNYLTRYTFIDVLAFIILGAGTTILLTKLFSGIRTGQINLSTEKINPRHILMGAFIFAIPSIVYLVIYYPGFIFPDSASSIDQALGLAPLDNHFPIFFTLFIRLCFKLSSLLGHGAQFGCVIFILVQIVIYAVTASYIVNWLRVRFHLCNWGAVIAAIYFLMPYFAASNIMLRTDGIFSCMIALMMPLTIDYFYGDKSTNKQRMLLIALFAISVIAIIWRNNGIYVVAFSTVVSLLYSLVSRYKKAFLYAYTGLLAVIAGLILIGPVENALNVGKGDSKVESYGVFINQMARVVAYNGDMTKSDREYMNRLLPIDEYKGKYRPSAVDLLKWDKYFDKSVLEHDFWKHYFSMLIRNPRGYFEAWVMNVHGYLCINISDINDDRGTVSIGNLTDESSHNRLLSRGIKVIDAEKSSDALSWRIFNYSVWDVPGSWIAYLMIILAAAIILSNRTDHALLLSFVPIIAIWGTMLVAAPTRYWARYIYSMQLVVPIILALCTKIISWRKLIKQG